MGKRRIGLSLIKKPTIIERKDTLKISNIYLVINAIDAMHKTLTIAKFTRTKDSNVIVKLNSAISVLLNNITKDINDCNAILNYIEVYKSVGICPTLFALIYKHAENKIDNHTAYNNKRLVVNTDKIQVNKNSSTGLSGGSLESAIINEAADIVGKRVVGELTMTFLETLRSVIDSNRMIKSLFPQTAQLFSIQDPYAFTNKINLVQNAFQNDLSNILTNINSWEQRELSGVLNKKLLPDERSRKIIYDSLLQLDKSIDKRLDLLDTQISNSNGKDQANIDNKSDTIVLAITQFLKRLPACSDIEAINRSIQKFRKKMTDIDKSLTNAVSSKKLESHWRKILPYHVKLVRTSFDGTVKTLDFWNKISSNSTLQHLYFLLSVYNELRSNRDPAEAISLIMDSDFIATFSDNKSLFSSCELIKIMSDGFRTTKIGGWVSIDTITSLPDREKLILLSLIYEKVRSLSLPSKDEKTVGQMLAKYDNNTLYQYLTRFINISRNIQDNINSFKEKAGKKQDSLNFKNFLSLYNGASNLIDLVYSPPFLPDDSAIIPDIEKLDSINNSAIQLYSDISHKYWQNIIGDAITLFQQIEGRNFPGSENIVKYGTFFADVAEAKNSDDIKQAVENIVLPPGSYSLKRESRFSVQINAYGGLDYNYNLFAAQGTAPFHNMNIGFTVPIGISFSWGHRDLFGYIQQSKVWKEKRKGGSSSIFVSLVDLGALVQFRLEEDSTAAVPQKVTFNQVFSPGIFYIYGFRKCPIALELGANIRPQLAQSFETSRNVTASQIRFTAGIVVDVPMFNIHSEASDNTKN